MEDVRVTCRNSVVTWFCGAHIEDVIWCVRRLRYNGGGKTLWCAVMLPALLLASCGSMGTAGPTPTDPAGTPVPSSTPATATPMATWLKTGDATTKDLFCGVLARNSITSGEGSGPNTFELRPATSARTGTIGGARFGGWASAGPPALGTYVCVWLTQGAPMGGFQSQVRSGEPGYIAEILPNGFTPPQGCAYVGRPTSDQPELAVTWKADCGALANRNARGTLGPAFTEQGWISCGSGLATATWRKGTSRLSVAEGSGVVGEYPTLTQRLSYTGGSSPSATPGCP